MAEEKIPLSYKGHPLRRKENLIYYGSMADKYIIMLQVMETKKVDDLDVLGTVFTAMFTVGASAATLGAGTVTADALRLRDTPAAEGEILATASGGTSVVVLEDTGNGWYKVNFNTVEGYMSSEYLTVSTTADAALGYGLVDTDGSSLNMRAAGGRG